MSTNRNSKSIGLINLFLLAIICLFSNIAFSQDIIFTEVLPNSNSNLDPNTLVENGVAEFFDMDNDGDNDLIITGEYGFNEPQVTDLYANSGNGNFHLVPGTQFSAATGGDISVGDVDGDSDLDIVISGHHGPNNIPIPTCNLYLNDGTGNFTLDPNTPFLPVYRSSTEFGDIDGDGDLDFLVTGNSELGGVSVLYENDGFGSFTQLDASLIGVETSTVIFEDLDADDDLDLVIAGESLLGNVCKMYKNDGSGNFTEIPDTPFDGILFSALDIGDIDGDGDIDLAINGLNEDSYEEVSFIYLNNGNEAFSIIEDSPFGMGQFELSDFDEDGDLDMLVIGRPIGSQNVNRTDIFANDGLGNFSALNTDQFTPAGRCALAIGDVNNDNHLDILLVGTTFFDAGFSEIYRNYGAGNFTPQNPNYLEPLKQCDAAFADIDGDSDMDLLIAGATNTQKATRLYINIGQGIYAEHVDTPFEDVNYAAIAFADVDGDNDQDVMLAGHRLGGYTTKLYMNDGIGNFTEDQNASFPTIVYGDIEFADIDGDNDLDVLVCGGLNEETSNCKLYKNDGNGNFTVIASPFENYWDASHDYSGTDINFFDTDGDGDKDVVLSSWFEFEISVTNIFLNDGTGVFSYGASPFEGLHFGDIDYADIDGDDDIDVIITGQSLSIGSSYNVCELYLNDGDGEFALSSEQFPPVEASSVSFADFDLDGDQDIVIGGDFYDGSGIHSPKLFLNNGVGNFSEIQVPFQGSSDGTVEVADIDGDGDQDVLIAGITFNNEIATKLWRNSPCLYQTIVNTTICSSESIIVNGAEYNAQNSKGVEFMLGAASDGCDSVVVVNLDVFPEINFNASTDNANITVNDSYSSYQWYVCNGDITPIEGATFFEFEAPENGNYAVEIIDSFGCTSISDCITTFDCSAVTVESFIDSTICPTDSVVVNGNVYNSQNSSGTEIFEASTINGCDSTVHISLNVIPQIDTIIAVNQDTITAVEGYEGYQWIDCNNDFNPIEGATNFEFIASENGSFAVEITNSSCSVITDCKQIEIEEEEEEEDPPVGVYPNPTEGGISIQFEDVHTSLHVVIVSTFGGEVLNQTFVDTNLIQIDLNEPSGNYIVEITDQDGTEYTYQFIII